MENPYLGSIVVFAGNFAPMGWAFCQGQLLSIAENQALFSLIGNMYGGNGTVDFALPNLAGRVAIGDGNGYTQAQTGGSNTVTLTVQNLPAHRHTWNAFSEGGDSNDPTGRKMANTTGFDREYRNAGTKVNMAANGVAPVGQAANQVQAFNIQQPFVTMNFIIALEGLYPMI